MNALTLHGVRDLRYERVADPEIRAGGDVILEVEVAGVCGSDLHPYHGREMGWDAGTVTGHEYVGRVVETGGEVGDLAVGDRVVGPFTTSCGTCFYCRRGLTARCESGQLFGWVERGEGLHGAQAEYLRVPLAESTLVRLPDDLPGEQALLAGDVLSTGFFCAELGGVEPGSVVVVVGCGPVGLMAVLGARELGAHAVFALDRLPERLALAETFGARPVDYTTGEAPELVAAETAGRGADVALEAVGSPESTRLAVDLLRPGGTLVAAGVHTEASFAFTPAEAYDKNLTYRAGRCSARHYLEKTLPLVAAGRYPLDRLVTHRLPLAEGPSAYRLFDGKTDGCIKVVLAPGSEPERLPKSLEGARR